MSEPYELIVDSYRMLDYDLQEAIDTYTVALAEHALTVGVAAPGATSLVEGIVKGHGGLWVLVLPPPVKEKQPLPKDAKYYKAKADRVAIEQYIEAQV